MTDEKEPKETEAGKSRPDPDPKGAAEPAAPEDSAGKGMESAAQGEGPVEIQKTLNEVKDLLNAQQTAAALDLTHLLSSKRRLVLSNFALGLSRGIGFFIGLSLFGALLLGTVAFAFDWIDDTLGLGIGNYIDNLVGIGEKFGVNQNDRTDEAEEERLRRMIHDYLVEEGLVEETAEPEEENAGTEPEGETPSLPDETENGK